MNEFHSMRNTIIESRKQKYAAKEAGIKVAARPGRELEEIYSSVDYLLPDLRNSAGEWIESHKKDFESYIVSEGQPAVENAYQQGLDKYLKQRYRFLKKENPKQVNNLYDSEYLEQTIKAYTYDFVQLLKTSEREGFSPTIGLQIASVAHQFNPSILGEINKEFPDIPISLIGRVLTNYTNPKEYLREIVDQISVYSKMFPDIPRWFIVNALSRFNEPQAYLQSMSEQIPLLEAKFPEFGRTNILNTLKRSKNYELYLEQAREKAAELRPKYNISNSILNYIVVHNPHNTEQYIDNILAEAESLQTEFPELQLSYLRDLCFLTATPELRRAKINNIYSAKSKFPEFSMNLITSVAKRHSNIEEYLMYSKNRVVILAALYPDMSVNFLKDITVRHNEGNDIKHINELLDKKEGLMKEFPSVKEYLIMRALTYKKPRESLINTLSLINQYKTEFPDMSDWVIERAVTHSVPKELLQRLRTQMPLLIAQNPDRAENDLYRVAFKYDNPFTAIQNIKKEMASLKQVYPQLSNDVLFRVQFLHADNSHEYINTMLTTAQILKQEYPSIGINTIYSYLIRTTNNPRKSLDRVLKAQLLAKKSI